MDEVRQNNKEDLGVEVSRPHVGPFLHAGDLVILAESESGMSHRSRIGSPHGWNAYHR